MLKRTGIASVTFHVVYRHGAHKGGLGAGHLIEWGAAT